MAKKTNFTEQEALNTSNERNSQDQNQQQGREQEPVHPDYSKETILLRDPISGRVDVVSELTTDKSGRSRIITTDPSLKNQHKFYQRLDSNFIANFFKNFRAQLSDPKTMPELYSVPYDKVPTVAADLRKLQEDPQNDLLQQTAKQHRVYTQTLEKIKFDQARMPKDQLAALGFDVAQLEKDGVFNQLELGRDSSELYPVKMQLSDNVKLDGFFILHPTLDENRNIVFELLGGNSVPEFERDENLRMQLSADDTKLLLSGKTLERPIMYQGEFCVAAFNRNTGRMDCTPCREIEAPDFHLNARLSQEMKSEFIRGGKVHLEGCHYYNSDNNFSCDLQFDARSKEAKTTNHRYSRPYVPEYLSKQLDRARLEDLYAYKVVSREGLFDKNGKPLNRDIVISRDTNSVTYVNRLSQNQTQTQTQSQHEFDKKRENYPENSMSSIDHFGDMENQSQRRGRGM